MTVVVVGAAVAAWFFWPIRYRAGQTPTITPPAGGRGGGRRRRSRRPAASRTDPASPDHRCADRRRRGGPRHQVRHAAAPQCAVEPAGLGIDRARSRRVADAGFTFGGFTGECDPSAGDGRRWTAPRRCGATFAKLAAPRRRRASPAQSPQTAGRSRSPGRLVGRFWATGSSAGRTGTECATKLPGRLRSDA